MPTTVSPAHVPTGLNFLLKNEWVVKGDSPVVTDKESDRSKGFGTLKWLTKLKLSLQLQLSMGGL